MEGHNWVETVVRQQCFGGQADFKIRHHHEGAGRKIELVLGKKRQKHLFRLGHHIGDIVVVVEKLHLPNNRAPSELAHLWG